MQQRVILLRRAEIEPDPPKAVQGLEVGARYVRGVVPKQTAAEHPKVRRGGCQNKEGVFCPSYQRMWPWTWMKRFNTVEPEVIAPKLPTPLVTPVPMPPI
jgi:hypothetical protein